MCLSSRSSGRSYASTQWLGRNFGLSCGPDRSRNRGEASASVILLKADVGEVVSHPSGWMWQLCAQRMAVGPGSLRPDGKTVNQRLAHLHVKKSDEPSSCIPFSLAEAGELRRSMAHASAEFSDAFRNQRER